MSVFVFDTPSPLKRVARNCQKFYASTTSRSVIYEPLNSLIGAGINDGFFSDSMDFLGFDGLSRIRWTLPSVVAAVCIEQK